MISVQKDINNELFDMAFFPNKIKTILPTPRKEVLGQKPTAKLCI